jgi:hypothetical protein
MKELKFTITGTIFVPDNVEYENDFENQIYSFKINDKTYSLIAGLEADDKEIIVTDENFKSHELGIFEYEDFYFED